MFLRIVVVVLFYCQANLALYDISDENLYNVKWIFSKDTSEVLTTGQNILISTSLGEKFECIVPYTIDFSNGSEVEKNSTATEEEILKRLFESRPCSVRTEFYWSYELCHRNYVRQFHEELLPDKSSKTQEYFLGYFQKDNTTIFSHPVERPGVLLGGSSYPYYDMKFVDGTPCDLTGGRRSTTVLYVCLDDEEGRIIQVSETESCQYQVVFATQYLCQHPAYRLPKPPVKQLPCAPREGSVGKPTSLLKFEKEQEQLSQHGVSNLAALFSNIGLKNIRVEANRRNNMIVYRIRTVDSTEDDETTVDTTNEQVETSAASKDPASRGDSGKKETPQSSTRKPTVPDDAYRARFMEFLSGKFCLQGRSHGWWQYEICVRSNVTQYHTDNQNKRTQVILLGEWDVDAHEKWLIEQTKSATSATRPSVGGIDLFYGDGAFCEPIGEAREVIVKLRCNAAATGIHLAFTERSECRYTALVESSGFCDMSVDEIRSLVY